ncbi:MAG: hypothetical protein LBR66_02485 [Candidatus Symbiothrix sp.]|jgi:hypothetical protein|nr:hypothetical protein [Candidatus Symbiothrix sp.]
MKKNYYLLISAFAAILAFAGCESNDETAKQEKILVPPIGNEDCLPEYRSFLELVSIAEGNSFNDYYIVRGIVKSEPIEYAGREFQIIDDLKGNFGEASSLTLWGEYAANGQWNEDNVYDFRYNKGDTLILFVTKSSWIAEDDVEYEYYQISICGGCRILNFSEGNVIGYINELSSEETMPYEQFVEQLNQILNNQDDSSVKQIINYLSTLYATAT